MKRKLPFTYLVKITVAANGTTVGQISIDTDADFEHHETRCHSTADGETDIRPNNFTVEVKNSNGNQGSNIPCPQALFAGAVGTGHKGGNIVLYGKRSTIDFTVTDTAAAAQVVHVAMIGYKVYEG